MDRLLRWKPSPSMVVALIALFVALAGTVSALPRSNTVFSDDIVNKQVRTPDLAKAAVKRGKLANGAVTDAKLANGAVTNAKLANGAVTNAKLADNAVASGQVLDGSLGTEDLSSSIPAVHVTRSIDQSIPDNTSTALSFTVERYDTAAMHPNLILNPTRLTAPVTGIYHVSAGIAWESDPDGVRGVTLRKNGVTPVAGETIPANGTAGVQQMLSTVVRLQSGDYVEVVVVHSAGGNLAVDKAADSTPEFSMTWLAPGP
jgi:hypothetical protein